MKNISCIWRLLVLLTTIVMFTFHSKQVFAQYQQDDEDDNDNAVIDDVGDRQRQQFDPSSHRKVHVGNDDKEFNDLLDKLESEVTNAKQISSSNNKGATDRLKNIKENDDDYFSNKQKAAKLQGNQVDLVDNNKENNVIIKSNKDQDEDDFYSETTNTQKPKQHQPEQIEEHEKNIVQQIDEEDYHLNDAVEDDPKNEVGLNDKQTKANEEDVDLDEDELLGSGSTIDKEEDEDDLEHETDDVEDHHPLEGDEQVEDKEQKLPTFSHAPVDPNDAFKLDFDQEIELLTQRSIEAKLDMEKSRRELSLKVQHRVLNDYASRSEHKTGCFHRIFNSSVIDVSSKIAPGWLGRMLLKLTLMKCMSNSFMKFFHLSSKPDCESVLASKKKNGNSNTWDAWNGEKDTIDINTSPNKGVPTNSELDDCHLDHLYLRQGGLLDQQFTMVGLIVSTANGLVAFTRLHEEVEKESMSRSISMQLKIILSLMWNSLFLKLKNYADAGFLVVEMTFQGEHISLVRPCSISTSSSIACSAWLKTKLGEPIVRLANELNKFGSRLDMCDEQASNSNYICEGWNTVYTSTTCMALMREEQCLLINNPQVNQNDTTGITQKVNGEMGNTTTSSELLLLSNHQNQKQDLEASSNNKDDLDFELNEIEEIDDEEEGSYKVKKKNAEWYKMCTSIANEEQQAISMPTSIDDVF